MHTESLSPNKILRFTLKHILLDYLVNSSLYNNNQIVSMNIFRKSDNTNNTKNG